MIADMSKIQIGVLRENQQSLLEFLQEEEVVHLTELTSPTDEIVPESDTAYLLAQVQGALEFLAKVRSELDIKKKKNLKDMFSSKPAANLEELQKTLHDLELEPLLKKTNSYTDLLGDLAAHIQETKEAIAFLSPWKDLNITGEQLSSLPATHMFLTMIEREEERVRTAILEIETADFQVVAKVSEGKMNRLFAEAIAHEDDREALVACLSSVAAEEIMLELGEKETPSIKIAKLKNRLAELKRERSDILEDSKGLLSLERRLQFAYDALLHLQEREIAQGKVARLPYTAVVTGWIPSSFLKKFTSRASKYFPEAAIEEIEPDEQEKVPIAFRNSKTVQPFEAVTDIYGKPAYNELDPSAALSLFFLISFGLALTDAGYGIVMMISMWAAERFFRLKRDAKKMVRLLFYAGGATTVLGALTGGWFGVSLEELPASGLKDFLLSFKLIDPISNPLGLLGVAFAIGIVQLLFAWVVRGYHHYKSGEKGAILLDDLPWITMVVGLLAWVGATMDILPIAAATPLKWVVIINAVVLVLTQGRQHKNPLLKLGAGILSLYGLVSFLSDTLSYSRLLALGLATAIIGLVVNLLAGMVNGIPVIGIVLAVLVLLIGHTFNLGINALGAFIHSGRLQFVEFFPKFIEGGGVPYKPFGRVSKYVDNPKDFT